jgi:hypothetical protein
MRRSYQVPFRLMREDPAMTAKKTDDVPFPVRGIPGGWRDFFDEGDDEVFRFQAEVVERDQVRLREVAAKQQGLTPGDLRQLCPPPERIDSPL